MPTSCWWFTQHRAAEMYFPSPPPVSPDITHTTHVCPHRFTLTSSCHPEQLTPALSRCSSRWSWCSTRHGRCGDKGHQISSGGLVSSMALVSVGPSLAQSSECKATSVLIMGHTPIAAFSPRTNQGDETGTENKQSKIKV